jgi:hypothetical protein
MEFSNANEVNLNATSQILKKFDDKEDFGKFSLGSTRSIKTVIDVSKTLEYYN